MDIFQCCNKPAVEVTEFGDSFHKFKRCRRTIKGRRARVDADIIKNCHAKLIAMRSEAITPNDPNFSGPELVQVVQEILTHIPRYLGGITESIRQ